MAASIIGGRNVDAGTGLRGIGCSWFVSRETIHRNWVYLKKITEKLLIIAVTPGADVSGPKE
jgi:hypothetical protein